MFWWENIKGRLSQAIIYIIQIEYIHHMRYINHSDTEQLITKTFVINCYVSVQQTMLKSTTKHAKFKSISILTCNYLFYGIILVSVTELCTLETLDNNAIPSISVNT